MYVVGLLVGSSWDWIKGGRQPELDYSLGLHHHHHHRQQNWDGSDFGASGSLLDSGWLSLLDGWKFYNITTEHSTLNIQTTTNILIHLRTALGRLSRQAVHDSSHPSTSSSPTINPSPDPKHKNLVIKHSEYLITNPLILIFLLRWWLLSSSR